MKRIYVVLPLLLAVFTLVGCTKTDPTPATGTSESSASTSTLDAEAASWWCVEHGIPEKICSLCDSKYAAECQKNGDWCKEHNRAESQCFLCNPDLEDKFAAQYEAKFGKKPPKPE